MIRSALLSVVLGLAASPAMAQVLPKPSPAEFEQQIATNESVADLEAFAGRMRAGKDYEFEALVWKRLVALRPHLGRYKYEMAAAYGRIDRKRDAYNALLELQKQGYAYDPSRDGRFERVSTTPVWSYIVEGLQANAKPFGVGDVAYTLPKADLLPESLAWDPGRKALLVGSARDGSVSIVQKDGSLKPLVQANAENGLWAVFDVLVDAERKSLWVASTAVPHFKGYKPESDLGRAGVFRFDLATGKLLEKHLSPAVPGQSFFMSSLALGPGGEVYVADGVNNAVYVVLDGKFRRFFHAPVLTSIRGMAVDAGRGLLYFADYELGILGIDLNAGKAFDVRVPETLALGGIDGLQLWKGQLVAVQGGMVPARVMRLALSEDGRSITEVQPLVASRPELTAPTLATVDGDTLYVIANSQKGNYDRFGLVRDVAKLEAVRIFKLPIDFAEEVPQMIPSKLKPALPEELRGD